MSYHAASFAEFESALLKPLAPSEGLLGGWMGAAKSAKECAQAVILEKVPQAEIIHVDACLDLSREMQWTREKLLGKSEEVLDAGLMTEAMNMALAPVFVLVENNREAVECAMQLLSNELDLVSSSATQTIAILLGPTDYGDPQVVARRVKCLIQAGAHEALVPPRDASDFALAIHVSLAKADATLQRIASMERRLKGAKTDLLFWEISHEIMPGFPQMRLLTEKQGEVIGDYVLDKLIGQGVMGRTYSSTHQQSHETLAVKMTPKGEVRKVDQAIQMLMEYNALKLLSHPNVVSVKGLVHARKSIYLFMKNAGSATLMSLLRNTSGMEHSLGASIFMQVAKGLAHCHERRVAHCDLKPENIVVNEDGHATIVDFNMTVPLDDVPALEQPRGTMPFMSPEVLRQCPSWDPAASDMWSLGTLLLEIRYGVSALCKLLSWPMRVEPSPTCADEIENLFSQGPASTIAERYFGIASGHMTARLLDAMLLPAPSSRASAAVVASICMEEIIVQ